MTDLPLPLAGRRVLVTRTREQAEGLVDRLHAAGASVAVVPLITTVPIADPEAIARSAAEVATAPAPRWVAFTSATAVHLVLRAVGAPAAMLRRGMAGATVWFPVAEGARGGFAESLRTGGASVTVQHIYRSAMPESAPERLRAALAGGVDAITVTSGSTAQNLVQAMGADGLPAGVVIVCIGDQTAAEARAAGLTVHAVADVASVEGLVSALTECLAPQRLR